MDLVRITFEQTLILALYVLLGAGLFKLKLVREEGVPSMTNLLLYLVNPLLILDSFCTTAYEARLVQSMLTVAVFAIVVHLLSILVASLVFRRQQEGHRKVMTFGVVFSNCGFFGLPLLHAIAGSEGVFYGAVYIAVFKLFNWTYGVTLMDPAAQKTGGLVKALVNPNTVSILIGLVFFFTQWKPPQILESTFHSIGLMNSPLAMIILGVQISALGVSGFLSSPRVWLASLVRVLLVPVLALGLALLFIQDNALAASVLCLSAAPTAVVAVLFAGKYGQDVRLSAQIVTLTTLLSILTVPGIISLFKLLT
ncbi:MAG: AEC family transporter [Christensenellales bacterium]